MTDLNRKYAWHSIKSAIRSYAKDPTPQHAEKVEDAWKEMRRMEAASHWRDWQTMRLDAGKPGRTP
jgi:hypothetical protein